MERVGRIELPSSTWKAEASPQCFTRMSRPHRERPSTQRLMRPLRGGITSLHYGVVLVHVPGVEPGPLHRVMMAQSRLARRACSDQRRELNPQQLGVSRTLCRLRTLIEMG